jgi:hypothetical protein
MPHPFVFRNLMGLMISKNKRTLACCSALAFLYQVTQGLLLFLRFMQDVCRRSARANYQRRAIEEEADIALQYNLLQEKHYQQIVM